MNSLSLDDQKKLALAKVAYPDVLWLPSNDNGWGYKAGYTWTEFRPTSPDTLMRLMFNLKIDVEWVELDEVGRGAMQCQVYRRLTLKRFLKHCRTPEEISQAIISCALTVIGGE